MNSFVDPLFASCPDRHGTGAEKWNRWAGSLDRKGREILPVWVADMDFQAPIEVLEAMHRRVDHGVFGYTEDPPGFAPSLAEHLERLHGWAIDPEHVVGTPGVVTGLGLTARLLAQADDEIITFTPIYPPFLGLPGRAGRRVVRAELAARDVGTPAARWEIDFDTLAAAVTPRSRVLWLCHPQNPTGMVHSRQDLLALAAFAERHRLEVISDEIWSDLILDGSPHVPFASLDHPVAARAVTLVAPSKTWNLAGLGCAAAIIPDPLLRPRWRAAGGGLVPMVNPLGYAAAEAAWRHGDPWRRRLLRVLATHRDLVMETVSTLEGLSMVPPRATYLCWIDCRDALKGRGTDAQSICEAAGLGTSDGRDFGTPGFVRINIACPTDRLREALRRLMEAFQGTGASDGSDAAPLN
ncbi:MAG: MalY/PatB family protein [Planctomycetaceae bacterium]